MTGVLPADRISAVEAAHRRNRALAQPTRDGAPDSRSSGPVKFQREMPGRIQISEAVVRRHLASQVRRAAHSRAAVGVERGLPASVLAVSEPLGAIAHFDRFSMSPTTRFRHECNGWPGNRSATTSPHSMLSKRQVILPARIRCPAVSRRSVLGSPTLAGWHRKTTTTAATDGGSRVSRTQTPRSYRDVRRGSGPVRGSASMTVAAQVGPFGSGLLPCRRSRTPQRPSPFGREGSCVAGDDVRRRQPGYRNATIMQ